MGWYLPLLVRNWNLYKIWNLQFPSTHRCTLHRHTHTHTHTCPDSSLYFIWRTWYLYFKRTLMRNTILRNAIHNTTQVSWVLKILSIRLSASYSDLSQWLTYPWQLTCPFILRLWGKDTITCENVLLKCSCQTCILRLRLQGTSISSELSVLWSFYSWFLPSWLC